MWKLFIEYSDKSKVALTGKTKEITDKQIEHYYHAYARKAVKAVYQQYPIKNHPTRDFKALHEALHMKPCPVCGHKAVVIHNIDWKKDGLAFHVACNRAPKGMDDLCEMIAGYAEDGKIKWFSNEMDAINYWNEQYDRKENS